MKITLPLLIAIGAIGATTVLAPLKIRFTIRVVGEDGQPIPGVATSLIFHPKAIDVENYIREDVVSDTQGNFTVEGPSQDGTLAGGRLNKDGYYAGGVDIPYFTKNDDVGHWLPWDEIYTVVLRKIGDPIAMYVKKMGADIPAIDEPYGYDLEKSDWVAPYGNGTTTDFIVTATSYKYTDYFNNEVSVTITFPNDGDGLQEVHLPKEFANSMFKWQREAPEAGYQPKLEANHMWSRSSAGTTMTNSDNGIDGYFFRVRTTKDKDGKITGAFYGKISGGVSVGPNNGKPSIGFTYYLNPNSNDRNLEWDPSKNLFPTPSDPTLQVQCSVKQHRRRYRGAISRNQPHTPTNSKAQASVPACAAIYKKRH